MEKSSKYKKAITTALHAVEGVRDNELRNLAFNIVLSAELSVPAQEEASGSNKNSDFSAFSDRKDKSLTDIDLENLFEERGGKIFLRVEPPGDKVPEQQRFLAEAILAGSDILLKKKSISALDMAEAADDWSIQSSKFSRNIQKSKLIQAKGRGKGLAYSLRPGALLKLKKTLAAIARGEGN